jgi:hypothetical protein
MKIRNALVTFALIGVTMSAIVYAQKVATPGPTPGPPSPPGAQRFIPPQQTIPHQTGSAGTGEGAETGGAAGTGAETGNAGAGGAGGVSGGEEEAGGSAP